MRIKNEGGPWDLWEGRGTGRQKRRKAIERSIQPKGVRPSQEREGKHHNIRPCEKPFEWEEKKKGKERNKHTLMMKGVVKKERGKRFPDRGSRILKEGPLIHLKLSNCLGSKREGETSPPLRSSARKETSHGRHRSEKIAFKLS